MNFLSCDWADKPEKRVGGEEKEEEGQS